MQSFFAEVKFFIFRPKTMDYSPWFDFWESKKSSEKRIPSERASQEEQNGTSFRFQLHGTFQQGITMYERLKPTAVTTFTMRVY